MRNLFKILCLVLLIEYAVTASYTERGMKLLKLGQLEEAIANFEKAIKLNPKNAAAFNNKGVAVYIQKNYWVALKCFDQAIQIAPHDFGLWSNKIKVLYKLMETELDHMSVYLHS